MWAVLQSAFKFNHFFFIYFEENFFYLTFDLNSQTPQDKSINKFHLDVGRKYSTQKIIFHHHASAVSVAFLHVVLLHQSAMLLLYFIYRTNV